MDGMMNGGMMQGGEMDEQTIRCPHCGGSLKVEPAEAKEEAQPEQEDQAAKLAAAMGGMRR